MVERWLVTGIGRGIGLGIAGQALKGGRRIIGSIRAEPSTEVELLQRAFAENLQLLQFDQRDDNAIFEAARSVIGTIDVIVANSAIYGPRSTSAFGLNRVEIADAFDVNVMGTLKVIEAFLPALSGPRPRIVAVTSAMGATTNTGCGSLGYRMSKAALNKGMQTVAVELDGNIAVACLRPGGVKTDMNGGDDGMAIEQAGSAIVRTIDSLRPSGRAEFLDYDGSRLEW